MRRGYSRLASTEERRNMRRAFVFMALTIGAILGIIFLGIPTLAKFAGFLTDIRKSSLPVEKNDTTPPAPPRFSSIPEATNKSNLEIEGSTEDGATIILSFNQNTEETVATNDGKFTFSLKLKKGENTIFATAKDRAGNESQKSEVYKVVFDDEEPVLTISAPSDGQSFFGSKQRQVIVQGQTEAEANLFINDRPVKVEDDGTFLFTTTLNEGDNSFNLKASDRAGNLTEKTITVHFSL